MSTSTALDVLSALVLEDGRRWGGAAHPFQWHDAKQILDEQSATPYHFLTRSRGGSKTSDLAGIAVAAMMTQLPRGSKLYGLAADKEQARLLVEAIAGFTDRTPELHGAIDVQAWKAVVRQTGVTFEMLAADAPSAWGLRPNLVVVDEIAQWGETPAPRRLWEAIASGAAKMPGCRMVVLTTAGDPSHWSRKILDHAISDPMWRINEVPGPAPWLDRERVEEQRRRLLDSSFRRLFLNQWTSSEDRLASVEDLRAAVTLDGPLDPVPGKRYVIGVDLGLKSDRTVAAVCHAEQLTRHEHAVGPLTVGARVVLDRMEVWSGSRDSPVRLQDVEEWVAVASREYGNAVVRFDPWQALGSAQRLRARGVRCEEFSFSSVSVGRLGSTLHLLIRNRLIDLPDDEDLIDELASVRLRETSPGVVRMDHTHGEHDDRAIGLALAATALIDAGVPGSADGGQIHGQTSGLIRAMYGDYAAALAADGKMIDIGYDFRF